jgi:dihydropteroate synthase
VDPRASQKEVAEPGGLPPRLRGLGRPVVVGVLNVTPDSFSDGGRWLDPDAAIGRGHALTAAGADIVDVGGESTRPGAERVSADEELRRVLPVVTALAAAGVAVSIDTTRAIVAERAVAAGAVVVNDVSGGLADEAMLRLIAGLAVPYVVVHSRGASAVMDDLARYDDVVAEVLVELGQRVDAAVGAGISGERLVLDPGLGFAKSAAHNWALLHRLDALVALGHPILLGASRKRFLGALMADASGLVADPEERDDATAGVSALAAAAGVWAVRVHEPAANLAAVKVGAAWRRGFA